MRKVVGKDAPLGESILARSVLAFVACFLVVGLTVNGSPIGASAGPLQASPSPGGTAPVIQILNPHPGYDPGLGNPPRPPGAADPPKISDRFDGIDSAYHLVAVAVNAPADAIVEASYVQGTDNEVTIGQMSLVPGTTGTYELLWDILPSVPDVSTTIRVTIFQQTQTGFVELAKDEVVADMEHNDAAPPGDTFPADETIEITWPPMNGPLGFYKGAGGLWRTIIDGMASGAVSEMDMFYSVAAPGKEPVYKQCGHEALFGKPQYHFGIGGDPSLEEPIPFQVPCTLAAADDATKVTAIAAVPEEGDKPDRSDATFDPASELSQEAADVHVPAPYIQKESELTISVTGDPNSGHLADTRRVPSGNNCLSFMVTLLDSLQRPVEGANIDVHIQGPTDQVQFGTDVTTGPTSGGSKIPDKGAHSTENAKSCDGAGAAGTTQGDHNIPGGDDIKHRESTGSGEAGGGSGSGHGKWRFHIWSVAGTTGFTDITVWVDDAPLPSPAEKRPADDDVMGPDEPRATGRAQWYPSAPVIQFVPRGDSAPAGTCRPFLVRARAGSDPIPQISVDVHGTGPGDALDFCDVPGGSPRTAPDEGPHDPEAPGESTDTSTTPTTHHTEGLTDDAGNFTFGVVSPTSGDTRLVGWIDGEPERDNDVQDSGEPSSTAVMSWASSSGEANVNFLNPSLYGALTRAKVAKQVDSNALYHIVTRVDAPTLVQGVEVQLGTGTDAAFVKTKDLGVATQVSGSDTYELSWAVDVADGDYTMRAHIIGTSVVADVLITVNNTAGMNPMDEPDSTVEITRPLNAQLAPFFRRSTPVEGIASSGAEGMEVYYTKQAANVPLVSSDWTRCGFLQLNGTGTIPQPFQMPCQLQASDQASQVTGIAAVPFDCQEPVPGAGCDASPTGLPTGGRNPGTLDSGDAHRVFGYDVNPIIGLSPSENEAAIGNCAKFVMQVTDESGQAIAGENVDVHAVGPGETPSFCDPADGSATARRAPDQGGHSVVSGHGDQGAHVADGVDTQHSEGETTGEGKFVFGVRSDQAGDTQISAWLDRVDDDVQTSDEAIDSSVMHWLSDDPPPPSCTQVGTAGPDVLTGTSSADRLCGRGGNDILKGKGADDILRSGRGNDRVRGGGGNDILNASRGKDRLFGDSGNDTLKGAAGRDRLSGGNGTDSCNGGPGRDRIRKCESSGSRAPDPRLVRGGVA